MHSQIKSDIFLLLFFVTINYSFLFCYQDFEVDENSFEYRALHPLALPVQKSLVKEHFEPVMEEDRDQSDSDVSEDESNDGNKTRAPR